MPPKKSSSKQPVLKTEHHGDGFHRPRFKICISGAAETGHCAPDAFEKAQALGRAIAERGMILITGATVGIPYWAAKGAKSAGGVVFGISPAASYVAHRKTYNLPVDYHDIIMYTGFDYAGRNLLLVRSSDAIISICGRMGTLNEFTIAFEDQKPIGILEGTGGAADMVRMIVEGAHRGSGNIVYETDPDRLLDKIVALIKKEQEG
ncbi:MAG: LOG family protein [Candidatus Liptonbacteria bacterium]|nr:LOG family protein [Candidatus Liptonbacteria bacterium]